MIIIRNKIKHIECHELLQYNEQKKRRKELNKNGSLYLSKIFKILTKEKE